MGIYRDYQTSTWKIKCMFTFALSDTIALQMEAFSLIVWHFIQIDVNNLTHGK